jgi:biopolymer transport protein ExbD
MRQAMLTALAALTLTFLLVPGCEAERAGTPPTGDVVLRISGEDKPMPRERIINLAATADGRITYDGKPIDLAAVTQAVSVRQGTNPDAIALLDLSSELTCEELETILLAIRDGQVNNLAFASNFAEDPTAVPFMLPPADLKLPDIPKSSKLVLTLAGEGFVAAKDRELHLPEVAAFVKEELAANPKLVVYLEAAPQARYADFFAVMLALREAGAKRISLWGGLRAG